MVDGVSSTSDSLAAYTTESNSTLDKDAFLQLMIAQLQNQDPLEPMDGTDYSAQLAQFSSLEQLNNINESIQTSIDANYLLTQSINNTMTATLIGKEAKIATDTISYSGQNLAEIGYEVPSGVKEVKVTVYDSAGNEVKTFDGLETSEGQYKLSWDFTDDNGSSVSIGDYTFEVEATAYDGESLTVAQYLIGSIDGVRFSSSGTSLVINGVEYSSSDIFEIIQANSNSSSNSSDEEDDSNETIVDNSDSSDYTEDIKTKDIINNNKYGST